MAMQLPPCKHNPVKLAQNECSTESFRLSAANVGPTLSLNNGYQNNGGFGSFTASGIPGTNYVVQFSTDMTTWTDETPAVQAAGNGLISFTDTVSLTGHGGTVYYRLRQQ
jgi:hypothetical protein